jgi:hypothetical protein
MKKYYIISNSTDESIIGKKYPQTKGIPQGYTFKWYDSENSMTRLTNKEYPNFKPDLKFELEEKAILTDVVSVGNISCRGFLLNDKLKPLFETFNIIDYKFYDSELKYQNDWINYFWFHPVKNNLNGVDFYKSKFIITNLAFIKKADVEINSLDDYEKAREENKWKHIRVEKLILTDEFKNKELDLFFFPLIHSYIFVSDRMVNLIEKNSITGFNIEKQNIIE